MGEIRDVKNKFPRSCEAAMVVHTIVSVVLLFLIESGLRELRMPDTKQRGTQHIRIRGTGIPLHKISEPTPRS